MKTILSATVLTALLLTLSSGAALAQQANPSGVWQCEYGTRNIYRKDPHTVHYQAVFQVMPDYTVQVQGQDAYGGWYGQGQWSFSQDQGGLIFSVRGQRSNPILGTSVLVFDSYLVSATMMNMNLTFLTGDIVASQCQRMQ